VLRLGRVADEVVSAVLRHLMVAAPGAAFASNHDVAAFVAQLLGDDPLAGPYTVAKVEDMPLCSVNKAMNLPSS
jgi:hypothetical protein